MYIAEQRYLSPHNRYSNKPCLLSIVDLAQARLAPAALNRLVKRLSAQLPGLERARALVGAIGGAAPVGDGARLAQLIQGVTLEVQRLASDESMVGFVGAVPKMTGRYRLVLPCGERNMAASALAIALRMVSAALAGQAFDLAAGLAALRSGNGGRRAATAQATAGAHAEKPAAQLPERRTASRRRGERGVPDAVALAA